MLLNGGWPTASQSSRQLLGPPRGNQGKAMCTQDELPQVGGTVQDFLPGKAEQKEQDAWSRRPELPGVRPQASHALDPTSRLSGWLGLLP